MIEFHDPTLKDREWISKRLAAEEERGSERGFASFLLWGPAYGRQVADVEGQLLSRVKGEKGFAYLWPVGEGTPEKALAQLEADAGSGPLRFICLTQQEAEALERLRPGQFEIEPDRDSFDYLYTVEKLSDLAGRKLHSKRNHCKRFEENNPGWVYEQLCRETLGECLEMEEQWRLRSQEREGAGETQSISKEKKALLTAVEHFESLEMEGGLLRSEGRVVAFTMASRICADTMDVHFEKAYGEIQGAFAMINREFARWIRQYHPEVRYLNREEDMGLEGLRKAKESYYPDLLLEKYVAVRS